MKCEKCNEREATVLYKQTVNGATTVSHLCAACAAAAQSEAGFSAHFPFGGDLFGNLFGISAPQKAPVGKHCACGALFSDVQRAGKVFCAKCYETFAEELEPTLRSLYGKARHTGRVPAKASAARDKQNRLIQLKSELRAAIEAEKFEDAARLRDEIRSMEKEEA